MQRRMFLTTLGAASAFAAGRLPSSASRPPRKVIVGTVMQPFWVEHPGIPKRLSELSALVDEMQAQSRRQYGRGSDLAVLPECAVTGEAGLTSRLRSVPLRGDFSDAFGSKARDHGCYIVVPTYLQEAGGTVSNAAVLFGRKGEVAGIYRKVHLVVSPEGRDFENGCTAGGDVPVFECDFGRLGIQICYDI